MGCDRVGNTNSNWLKSYFKARKYNKIKAPAIIIISYTCQSKICPKLISFHRIKAKRQSHARLPRSLKFVTSFKDVPNNELKIINLYSGIQPDTLSAIMLEGFCSSLQVSKTVMPHLL